MLANAAKVASSSTSHTHAKILVSVKLSFYIGLFEPGAKRTCKFMMKKEESKILLKYVTRVVSPLFVIALISLSFTTTIFIYKNSSFEGLKATFRICFNSGKQLEASDGSALSPGSLPKQSKVYELVEQKSTGKIAWSRELQDWTLVRGNSKELWSDPRESEHGRGRVCIWPEDCSKLGSELHLNSEDRIVDQLRLFDDQANKSNDQESEGRKIFKILPPTYSSYPIGRELFLNEACPMNRCSIIYDKEEADALIFENSDVIDEPPKYRRIDQIWIAYLLESPCHTFDNRFARLHRGKHEFNWTASYRSDSDLVTPYSKFVPFNDKIYATSSSAKHRSLIRGKEGKVAWFASNCNAANDRLEYAKELGKYIQVDIYGRCGNLTCDKWNQTGCFEMINRSYKFYLSFENSNCRQYITEKLFRNALGYNDLNHLMLPIVMGPPREDYLRYAPPASFIHVDDFGSPKELAEYLKLLDSDDALYYSYLHWKTLGRFIDTKFMCRVCALLHESHSTAKRKSYTDIKRWWTTCNGSGDCCA